MGEIHSKKKGREEGTGRGARPVTGPWSVCSANVRRWKTEYVTFFLPTSQEHLVKDVPWFQPTKMGLGHWLPSFLCMCSSAKPWVSKLDHLASSMPIRHARPSVSSYAITPNQLISLGFSNEVSISTLWGFAGWLGCCRLNPRPHAC